MSTKYYVDSFAYDYEMFSPRKTRQTNVIEINRKNVQTKQAAKTKARPKSVGLSKVLFVALALTALALIVTNLFIRAQITEVTSQINAIETKIERAEAEGISLEMQLENSISIEKLEQEAAKLGMQKTENYQINYIEVNNEDSVSVK